MNKESKLVRDTGSKTVTPETRKLETGIKTVYYDHRLWVLKTNRAFDANRAVATCVLHMQINHYGASVAEVYDAVSGELHAVLKRGIRGDLGILYKRDPRQFERKYASALVLKKS